MLRVLAMLCLAGLLAEPTAAIGWSRSEPPLPLAGGADAAPVRDELSAEREALMTDEIRRSVQRLRNAGRLAEPDLLASVTYGFPLRLAPGLPGAAGFRVSAFVDHDPVAGVSQVRDYAGGTRTYDGHRGTDYALWPFVWNKVEASEMQVVAAAAGTIAFKADVDPTDRNPCDGGSASDPWNYIALVHADGRLTIYGHLRYGSLTSKGIGQTVAQGEILGAVASSGSSSGPHLHFEVRFGSYSGNEWIDPYSGPHSQAESLWASQRPYLDSAINRLATHSSPPSTPDPCALTATHVEDDFSPPRNIYFYAFYRDYQGALTTELRIYRPDGSVFQSWPYATAIAFSSASSSGWVHAFPADSPAGTWRFEALYNGQTYETFFNVSSPPGIAVTSPNGGEAWNVHLAHPVTWTDNLGGDVNIALYEDDVHRATLVSNTASDGEFLWTPGAAVTPGPGLALRVTSVDGPDVFDASDASFVLIDETLFSDGFETGSTVAWAVVPP